jgi:hypothetical protein
MNYVALLSLHSSMIEADRKTAMERRAGGRYPDGVSLLAEYWPIGATFDVMSIVSSARVIPVMKLVVEWSQHFDVNIWPALPVSDLSAVRLYEESQIRSGTLAKPHGDGLVSADPLFSIDA